jgi:hypothetical protein
VITRQRINKFSTNMAMLLHLMTTATLPSHGSLLYPLPRGGVDRDESPFSHGGFPSGHYPCSCTNGTEKTCYPVGVTTFSICIFLGHLG